MAHASNFSTLGDWLEPHEGWRSELPDELEVGTTLIGVAGARLVKGDIERSIERFEALYT